MIFSNDVYDLPLHSSFVVRLLARTAFLALDLRIFLIEMFCNGATIAAKSDRLELNQLIGI